MNIKRLSEYPDIRSYLAQEHGVENEKEFHRRLDEFIIEKQRCEIVIKDLKKAYFHFEIQAGQIREVLEEHHEAGLLRLVSGATGIKPNRLREIIAGDSMTEEEQTELYRHMGAMN